MKYLSPDKLLPGILLPALLWLTGPALALQSDREQPIYITADHVEIDKGKGFSKYTGRVHIRQGSVNIRGELVLFHHQNGEVEKVIINGEPASFQQQPDKGSDVIVSNARRMEYFAKTSRLFLIDDAQVTQGANRFSGERIEYDIYRGTVVAKKDETGKSRVRAIIAPAEEKN